MKNPSLLHPTGVAALVGLLSAAACTDTGFAPDSLDADPGARIVLDGGASASDVEAQQDVRLRARLSGTSADPLASGHADWEERTDGRLRFSTEVEDVSIDGVGRVRVLRQGVGAVFTAPISIVAGFGDLNLDTDNGDQVPVLQEGDRVIVFNAERVRILVGTLALDS